MFSHILGSFCSRFVRALLVLFVVAIVATPTWAEVSVFVRFGDGMIVNCPRHVATGYCQQGAVVVPYVPQGYMMGSDYYNGYRAYYPQGHHRVNYRPAPPPPPRGHAWGYYNRRDREAYRNGYQDRNHDGYPDGRRGRHGR